jgi:hypothetical protein
MGMIALCGGDIPGLITSDRPEMSQFEDVGGHGRAMYWPGVNLLTGEGWGSRSPVVLGTFAELLSSGLPVGEWIAQRRKR